MEIAVIGAGPAGLRVAERTASAGYETVVLEKKSVIGKPVQCAGIVSPRVISLTETNSGVTKPKKAIIHSPSGNELVIKAKNDQAIIIDRAQFDRELADKAIRAGAEIKLASPVKKIKKSSGCGKKIYFSHNGQKKTISPDVIVGADGPGSIVRRSEKLPSPDKIMPAVQALVPDEGKDVHIHLGKNVAPGFFLWDIPSRTGRLIGLASSDGNTFQYLQNFLRSKGLEKKVIAYLSGTIPLGDMGESVKDDLMLVGDSACHVKPMSGGGIYFGLKAADMCSDVLINAIEENDTSKERLKEYHEHWHNDIGKNIMRGMRARPIFENLSDEDLDKMIQMFQKERTRKVIEEMGDIDNPSRLIKPLLKASPDLLKFTGPVIKSFF